MYLLVYVYVDINLGVELLACGINVCSTSVNSVNFPKCLHHVSPPSAFYESSSCFILLPVLRIACPFALCVSHSVVHAAVCHWNFHLYLPVTHEIQHIFIFRCLWAIRISYFERSLFKSFAHFFPLLIDFLKSL